MEKAIKTIVIMMICGVLWVDGTAQGHTAGRDEVLARYGQVTAHFEQVGESGEEGPRFVSRGRGYALLVSRQGAMLALKKPAAAGDDPTLVRMQMLGSNPRATIVGTHPHSLRVNYFIGNDPARWRIGEPTYGRVRHQAVYPGIDLEYYGNQGQIECDFIVQPGADPRRIRLGFYDHRRTLLAPRIVAGELVLGIGGGQVRLKRPVIYQEQAGSKTPIPGGFTLVAMSSSRSPQVGFRLGRYDRTRPLVIDPILSYSSYLGGPASEAAKGVAVDAAGNAYVTGQTFSFHFPTTPHAVQWEWPGGVLNAFVTKLSPEGSTMIYSTFLGGTKADEATGIAVDGQGHAFLTGITGSYNFPTTPNAFSRDIGGIRDSFVTKLSPDGQALVYSTFLGAPNPGGVGGGDDRGRAIAVDAAGSAYVTGETHSGNFPITPDAVQPQRGGGFSEAFVTKLNADGTALVYSTYLGGSNEEAAYGIAVDQAGAAYVTGSTSSMSFPVTANPIQFHLVGVEVFVTKINPQGTALDYSTFLGGTGLDIAYAIAVDANGSACVTGQTTSSNFPVTPNAVQPFVGGARDAFVSKLNPVGSGLVFSTRLGGDSDDIGKGIAVSADGTVYLAGFTQSANFPKAGTSFQTDFMGGGYDAFVTAIDASGTPAIYSTYLGGSHVDYANAIAVNDAGDAYVAGETGSTDFPVQQPFQRSKDLDYDAFITKITNPDSN